MDPYILIIKQFLIDKHVTEKDLLELIAKNEVKDKEGKKVKKKKVDNIPTVAEIKKSILKKGWLKK
jgi:hypothetical protein